MIATLIWPRVIPIQGGILVLDLGMCVVGYDGFFGFVGGCRVSLDGLVILRDVDLKI